VPEGAEMIADLRVDGSTTDPALTLSDHEARTRNGGSTTEPQLAISASARIMRGKNTNRVRTDGSRGRIPKQPKPARKAYAGSGRKKGSKSSMKPAPILTSAAALRRYRRDPLVRGLDTTQTTISLPVEELARIDELARRVQMSRSCFLRQAAKYFAVYLEDATLRHFERRVVEGIETTFDKALMNNATQPEKVTANASSSNARREVKR
jgi:predicted transcriptional regulator